MCGIIGGITKRGIANILLDGLTHLEYRGYDSAGLVVLDDERRLSRARAQGKVHRLKARVAKAGFDGHIGIAHTRWATHGEPSERNAHPHVSNEHVAVVHNGIIENYQPLREQLIAKGYVFESDTDTEVIVHLFYDAMKHSDDLAKTASMVATQLQGAFALAFISASHPDSLVVVRQGSPLCVGLGNEEHFIASDHLALLGSAQQYCYLEDGDIAVIGEKVIQIVDLELNPQERVYQPLSSQAHVVHKGDYQHFMLKEIYEQPQAISDTLEGRLSRDHVLIDSFGPRAKMIFSQVKQIHIAACGTSYFAGQVAEYWFEQIVGMPCKVQIASEYRYHPPVVQQDTLFLTLSQSGETADTLAALRLAKERGYLTTVAICNVADSSLVRETEVPFLIHAGPEIGVASTKAFTCQLAALLLLVASLRAAQGDEKADYIKHLEHVPVVMQDVLALSADIKEMAKQIVDRQHALFLGRGSFYPLAEEGALKLKEISYIHAEAYPAGELKHGPLALIDKKMPVIVLLANDHCLSKMLSNMEEVKARGGELFVFAETGIDIDEQDKHLLKLPSVDKTVAPLVYTLAFQLLAYHVAVLKGTDVDQPRNLAKSVTVE